MVSGLWAQGLEGYTSFLTWAPLKHDTLESVSWLGLGVRVLDILTIGNEYEI